MGEVEILNLILIGVGCSLLANAIWEGIKTLPQKRENGLKKKKS